MSSTGRSARYERMGNYIQYWGDSSFTADGHFHDDALYRAGMIPNADRRDKLTEAFAP
ncbi:Atu4866 domain-containing protein [Pseudomonas sp. PDM04]|uniref:Atu4866 domain-containing protein n=1 Tax=Pseudomonas sp. PDM04 TaxID=2769296 RepID=UPI001CE1DFDD|nr:Atu4866 domain-containing protein [Pseudomonas sp. PDM04]